MRSLLLGVLVAAGVVSSASAQWLSPPPPPPVYPTYQAPQTSSQYDWRTGNRYSTQRQSDGSTTYRGTNLNTGAMWRGTIEPNGNQRGTDANGNLWRYNQSTGSYMSTDGTVCVGKGYARTCSGGK